MKTRNYLDIIRHPAREARMSFGYWREATPECWTQRGFYPAILPFMHNGEWTFVNSCGNPVYGTGTQSDPFRTFYDVADLYSQVRVFVLKNRARYPSRYPYRVSGGEMFEALGFPNPNRTSFKHLTRSAI